MPIFNPGGGSGTPGPTGPIGPIGLPGFDGYDGEDGIQGPQGLQGIQGPQGIPGTGGSGTSTIGIPGIDGEDGSDSFIPGTPGSSGIQGLQGFPGQDGIDGIDDDLWPGFNSYQDNPLEQIPRIQDQSLAILPNNSVVVIGPYTINSGKKLTIGSGGRFLIEQGAPDTKASVFVLQASAFTNSDNVEKMAGLGATNSTQIVTPKVSGNLRILITGIIDAASGGGTGYQERMQLYYGVGTPPAAGTTTLPSTGTKVGNPSVINMSLRSTAFSYSINVIVMNLLIGVTYWFDISMFAETYFDTGIPTASAVNDRLIYTNFIAFEL